jgi:hypothetical protein
VVVDAVVVPFWRSGGIVRWVVVGALAYSVVSVPWALGLGLRMRWNAPEAERLTVRCSRSAQDGFKPRRSHVCSGAST